MSSIFITESNCRTASLVVGSSMLMLMLIQLQITSGRDLVVRIRAFQARGPGSNPGARILHFIFYLLCSETQSERVGRRAQSF